MRAYTQCSPVAIVWLQVAGTLGAGSWQLSRYQWKVGLIETIQEQLALPPIELPPFPNGTTYTHCTTHCPLQRTARD